MIDNDSRKALEDFLMDIDILDEVYTKLSHFNVFDTLGIINVEIRHSNVLAWLLNPNENHGLDDTFIKKFVQSLFYRNRYVLSKTGMSLFSISLMNYSDFYVRREWRNIDVLAVSEQNRLVLIIENKVWSKESKFQLNKYFDTVNQEFEGYKKIFVFLTPEGDSPSDEDNWGTIDYSEITEILSKSLELKRDTISASVKLFLEQYLSVLRRYIVGDMELEKICREIYYKHQKALDLIYEFKPDIYYDIAQLINSRIDSNSDLVKDICTKHYIRFITKKLDNVIEKKGEGWTATKRILLFEFQIKNEKIMIKLYIGPGDGNIRQKLYNITQKNADTFKCCNNTLNEKWTQIFSKEILSKNYFENDEKIKSIHDELGTKIMRFFTEEIPKIESILLEGYETEI